MPPRTPRPLKCSIGKRVGTDCGLSARYPLFKEYIPILYCKRDVTVHLKRSNVSSSPVSLESELILLRSGHFDVQGDDVTVCPKYRDVLGLSWHPAHQLTCFVGEQTYIVEVRAFRRARRRYNCMPKVPGRSWAILASFSFLYTSITWVQERKLRHGCIEENVSR